MADVSRGGRQILVVAFDLAESNWPLRLSYPLFMQNVVSWTPRAALADELSVPTGRPLSVLPTPDAESVVVRNPQGDEERLALDPMRPVFYGGTERAGVYEIDYGSRVTRIAVNLLDREESAVSPAASIQMGRSEIQARESGVEKTHELWRWLVAVALGILMIEWWVYSRRAWV